MVHLQIDEIVECRHRGADAATVWPEELGRDNLHRPVHACNALAVPADTADGSRNVRAVGVDCGVGGTVEDRRVAVEEVPPVDVVDEPIAVVVDGVAGDFAWIDPDVGSEVGVSHLNAFIDHAHYHVRGARVAGGPGLGRASAKLVRGHRGITLHSPQ